MSNKEKCKSYYEKHKAEISQKRTKQKIWLTKEFKEYHRQYYLRNKERLCQQQKEWRRNNPEKVAGAQRKYALSNKAKISARQKRYYIKHRVAIRELKRGYSINPKGRYAQLKYSAQKRGMSVECSRDEFCEWFNAQEKICHYCGTVLQRSKLKSIGLTIDRKNNSKNYQIDNIVLCCRRCNLVKGDVFTESEMVEIGDKYLRRKF